MLTDHLKLKRLICIMFVIYKQARLISKLNLGLTKVNYLPGFNLTVVKRDTRVRFELLIETNPS
jgi:hypothetical protein